MNLRVSPVLRLIEHGLAPLCALALPSLLAQAQDALTVNDAFWQTDGPVHSVLVTNNIAYIGGRFSYVGRQTGGVGKLDLASAQVGKRFPSVDGPVLAAVSDGGGGWYLGGAFTNVGGFVRTNLVRIRSDNSVDPDWTPNPNGPVAALARTNNTIYVGGAFDTISSQPRAGIASLNESTAEAGAWDPSASGFVRTIVVAGATVYAGGSFTSIGGVARNGLAALNAKTGLATSWDPNAGGDSPIVMSITLSGNTAYVCGTFTSVGSKPRNRVAALDLTTGTATAWNPDANGPVNALVVNGNTVYVGGQFSSVGSVNRNRLAALDASTARALDWAPNPDADVHALALSGNTLFVGGNFHAIAGTTRSLVAALDATTGNATAWQQTFSTFASATTPVVISLSLDNINLVAGGTFVSVGGVARNNLAALDVTTGDATPWNPNSDGQVNALGLYSNVVYVAGSFTHLGGQLRNLIAALSPATGVVNDWNPNAGGTPFGAVNAFGFSASRLFLAGSFSNIAGRTRNGLAAIDLDSGQLVAWNPSPASKTQLAPNLQALQISDTTVYVGGNFDSIGAQSRARLAAISSTSGAVLAWSPAPNDVATALAIDGTNIYVGGNFTAIGGQVRSRIAALEADKGIATSWNPDAGGTAPVVLALAAVPNNIFVGGQFSSIGGEFRNGLANIQPQTGQAASWDPNANGPVRTLYVTTDAVYAGGDFTSISGRPLNYFAVFSRQPLFVLESTGFSSDHQFSFTLNAHPGQRLSIQASSDLAQWTYIDSLTNSSNSLPFTDRQTTNLPMRFYRAVLVTTP